MTPQLPNAQETLPEYADNPLIARLPPIKTSRELYDQLNLQPSYAESERSLPGHLRAHCLRRLMRYFEPMDRHLALAQTFDITLRQGYLGRNPHTRDFIKHLQDGADRISQNQFFIQPTQGISTAQSFSVVGCSGVGKSTAMGRILNMYPQVIEHREPFLLYQLTWLKLDCPRQASVKQLCQNFFGAIDQILGTSYLLKHGKPRMGVDHMMLQMSQVASLHALGVLIIDEIQHLRQGRGNDPEDFLNFLVTLVNTIGVPVIVIGTMGSMEVLQGNFREARRATGSVWERLPKGGDWDTFVERMWRYQWLRENTPLTRELMDILYEESQGIIDIVTKLYMLTQAYLIRTCGARRLPERITPDLVREVARRDLAIIQPMMAALRTGDRKALQRYDDLLPLHQYVENALCEAGSVPQSTRPLHRVAEPVLSSESVTLEQRVVASLEAMGIASDLGETLFNDALKACPTQDVYEIIGWITEQLRQRPPVKTAKPKQRTELKPTEPDDLRVITLADASQDNYEALAGAGVIRDPLKDDVA